MLHNVVVLPLQVCTIFLINLTACRQLFLTCTHTILSEASQKKKKRPPHLSMWTNTIKLRWDKVNQKIPTRQTQQHRLNQWHKSHTHTYINNLSLEDRTSDETKHTMFCQKMGGWRTSFNRESERETSGKEEQSHPKVFHQSLSKIYPSMLINTCPAEKIITHVRIETDRLIKYASEVWKTL